MSRLGHPNKGQGSLTKVRMSKVICLGYKCHLFANSPVPLALGMGGGGSETAPACFIYWSDADKDTGILGLYFSLESKKEV